ncbi:uncharacterized protein LOC131146976 [Malania oleifera]|uniref:uncharacterized protein LOC131146976 n=1 Tax=Malania oleifera TaxID=397392 RepID=UPI0025AE5F82|nr:uncharacterized protein LOC131146976 [Malania oleifera]
MSALTTAWSPSSCQLRLAFHCRRSPGIIVRTHAKMLDRQVRVFSLAQEGARDGNGVERRRTGDSWTSTNSSPDSFAGWSSSNGAGPSGEYRRRQWLTGIVGATVAGVVLFAGLTLATFSLSKRNTSRPKQQMEPLTPQEEVSLVCENLNSTVQDNGNESSSNGSKTNLDKNSSSSQEHDKSLIENRLNDGKDDVTSSAPNVILASNAVEAISNTSMPDDFQYESAFNDMSVASELPESEIINGSSRFKELDDSRTVSAKDLNPELKVNLVDTKFSDSSASDGTAPQEGLPGSREAETCEFLLDYSSASIAHTGEPLAVNISVNPEVDADLEPYIVSKHDVKTANPVSTEENLDLQMGLELSAKESDKSLEENNLNGSTTSGTTSLSALLHPVESEHENEITRSRKFYEVPMPQNSFSAGIPAPSVVSAALQVLPGKVLVPAVVDQVQGQALAALQILKVIESDVQPSDLCTRREYARWLVSASSALSRNAVSKVYPAMYIENVTELAFDDVTPEDPDFSSIQGLAEAGLISSKLSRRDMLSSINDDQSSFCFSPESPLSRQDLVSWKMALEKRHLPEADRKILHELSGFIDIDKINPDAWPAILADLSAGDQGIMALAFGYTKLFQPDKPVTKAQAAIALATGEASDIVSEELARIEAESMAENAVAAHSALVAQVEKDINASFEKELSIEREKINAVEKLAEEARQELERLRAQREEENLALMKEHAAVESEMEVLSKLRREVEEQLQNLMSNKVELSYEKDRISKLQKEAEHENQEIARLHYELEVERKALSMARAWAEDEAKRAREQAKALEEARDRWERHGIKVIVDSDLREEASTGVTWLNAGKQFSIEGTISRAENLADRLKAMAAEVRGKSRNIIEKVIQRILWLISILRERASEAGKWTGEFKDATILKVRGSAQELQQSASEFSLALKEGAKRVAGDCREGVEKITQKFKT